MHLNAAYLLLFFLCMHAVRMCERYGQRTRVIVDFPVPGQIQNATGQISTLFFTFFFFVPPHRLRLKRMTHEKNTEIKKTQQICYLLSEVNWLVVWMPHNTRFHCIFRHGKSKFYTSQKTTIAQKAVRMCVYSSFVAYFVSEPVA